MTGDAPPAIITAGERPRAAAAQTEAVFVDTQLARSVDREVGK